MTGVEQCMFIIWPCSQVSPEEVELCKPGFLLIPLSDYEKMVSGLHASLEIRYLPEHGE